MQTIGTSKFVLVVELLDGLSLVAAGFVAGHKLPLITSSYIV